MSVDIDDLRRRVHHELLQTTPDNAAVDQLAISRIVMKVAPLLDPVASATLVKNVLADVHGLGPLEGFLRDPLCWQANRVREGQKRRRGG